MAAGGSSTSWLLLEEHFKAGDRRFLDELYKADAEKKLKSFAERWYKDARPFARDTLREYVLDGCDRPHHRPLVKKLYKTAEESGDDELMGSFMVAFDRLLQRQIVPIEVYDWRERITRVEQQLRTSPEVPKTLSQAERHRRFSLKTRLYLARRAFRYFRKIGAKDRERYFKGTSAALKLYKDDHLNKPEHLLDAWGLVHVLYHDSPVLVRDARGIRLAPGRTLSELSPAPMYPEVWRDRFPTLLELAEAPSRTVRAFALGILRAEHGAALRALPVSFFLKWLRSPNEDLQHVAIDLLSEAGGLETLPIAEWLTLLAIDNLDVLPRIVTLFEKNVAPSRLDLAQCVRLATAQAGPVAELGLRWVRERKIAGEKDLRALLPLAEAKAPAVRETAVGWLVSELKSRPESKPEDLREVIDSKFADARKVALPVIEAEPRFETSPILWAALAESPHDEVRGYLVRHLEKKLESLQPKSVEHVWATSLLAIHRGGKAKQRVIKQVSDRIIAEPQRASDLAPLLRVALRSVRVPERRAALAAVTRAAFEKPILREQLGDHFPELVLPPEDAVCR